MASVAQVRANRLNAQKSTGPRTPEGKAVVAQNAVQHGLLARQVVIRGEDPGEFELYRDRMLEDLGPVGSLEGLLAERVAHLGWRLRRAERLESAAWATLEADHVGKAKAEPAELARHAGVSRHEGEPQAEEESVRARVIVADFGDARLLDRLLGYERRIENSLYRTVGELQKRKKLREADTPGADESGGTSPRTPEAELHTSNFTLETPETASDDATTNGAGPEGTSCETKPIGSGAGQSTRGEKEEELGRGRPSYEEASDDGTANAVPAVELPRPSSIPSFQPSSLRPARQTKPIGDGEDPSCAGPFSQA